MALASQHLSIDPNTLAGEPAASLLMGPYSDFWDASLLGIIRDFAHVHTQPIFSGEPSTSGHIHSENLAAVRYGSTIIARRSRLAAPPVYYNGDYLPECKSKSTKHRTTRASWSCSWATTNALDCPSDVLKPQSNQSSARSVYRIAGYFEVNSTPACLQVSFRMSFAFVWFLVVAFIDTNLDGCRLIYWKSFTNPFQGYISRTYFKGPASSMLHVLRRMNPRSLLEDCLTWGHTSTCWDLYRKGYWGTYCLFHSTFSSTCLYLYTSPSPH